MLYGAEVAVCSEINTKTNEYNVDRMHNSEVLNLLVHETNSF